MAGLGFVGAGGVVGGAKALEEILAQRLLEQKLEEQRQQQEFENRMALRQADTGDSRFERTQGHTEKMGEGGLEISRGHLGLSRDQFGHNVSQDQRGNRIEDEDRATAASDRAGKLSFLDEVAGGQTDPTRRNLVRGLKYNVNLPDLRSPEQRGAETGTEELSAFNAGGRQVRQGETDIIVGGNIRSSNAAADRARESAPPDKSADKAAAKAAEVKRVATELLNHPGLNGAFGVVGSWTPTLRQATADAETLINSLRGMLTLENMEQMKGVLSDKDMEIVLAASTTINQKMSESAAREELKRLGGILAGAENAPEAGTPRGGNAAVPRYERGPDGKVRLAGGR